MTGPLMVAWICFVFDVMSLSMLLLVAVDPVLIRRQGVVLGWMFNVVLSTVFIIVCRAIA